MLQDAKDPIRLAMAALCREGDLADSEALLLGTQQLRAAAQNRLTGAQVIFRFSRQ